MPKWLYGTDAITLSFLLCMAGFMNKISIPYKSLVLPYLARNKVLIVVFVALAALLIDTNIRLRKVENINSSLYYNLEIDKIGDTLDSIENTLDAPLMENDINGEIGRIQRDISNLESKLNDVQEKVDDLWFKLY
ncbi:hypothetical protein C4561_00785 [candidate division WWE3 bacterium]|uniref:Uncharacterized protein n=1 Tax=candidate division WWE3 bacterium TaxID=2053526 RepID=A0A3A4ZNB0_UNCKA|nr:MAG: hypothetical protein C4561_00785 [candidate division WWE3 bacterium]